MTGTASSECDLHNVFVPRLLSADYLTNVSSRSVNNTLNALDNDDDVVPSDLLAAYVQQTVTDVAADKDGNSGRSKRSPIFFGRRR